MPSVRLILVATASALLMGCIVRGDVGNNGADADERVAVGPIPSGTVTAALGYFQGEQLGDLGANNAIVGDLDGDGFDDFVLVDPASDRAAYLFYGRQSFSEQSSVLEADAILRGGESVAGLGDINGDGLADFALVGARAWVGHVIYGSAHRLSGEQPAESASSTIVHPAEGVTVMSTIKGAGDVNGDGLDDLLVNLRNGQERFVFVVHGNPERLPSNFSLVDADATFAGTHEGYHLGSDSGSVGDVNGDGYDELLLTTFDGAGRTRVAMFYGGEGNISGPMSLADADARLEMPTNPMPIASLGDLDDDGLDDFAVASETRIAAFYGRRERFSGTVVLDDSWFSLSPERGPTNFRSAQMATGDLDGDGHLDMVVADPNHSRSEVKRGALYTVLGAPHRYETQHRLGESNALMYGTTLGPDGNLGFGLASGGDVNGDGYADILVGAPRSGGTTPGAVYVVFGGPRVNSGSTTSPPEP